MKVSWYLGFSQLILKGLAFLGIDIISGYFFKSYLP